MLLGLQVVLKHEGNRAGVLCNPTVNRNIHRAHKMLMQANIRQTGCWVITGQSTAGNSKQRHKMLINANVKNGQFYSPRGHRSPAQFSPA